MKIKYKIGEVVFSNVGTEIVQRIKISEYPFDLMMVENKFHSKASLKEFVKTHAERFYGKEILILEVLVIDEDDI